MADDRVYRSDDPTLVTPGDGSTRRATSDCESIAGLTLDGRYRVERLIGRGGMGAVYRAVDVAPGFGDERAAEIVASGRRASVDDAVGYLARLARNADRAVAPNEARREER